MKVHAVPVVCAVAAILGCSGLTTRAGSSGFAMERRDDRVDILMNGRPYTAFHFNSKWDKPFLFPIRTVSGAVISRGWPVEPRQGDERDHAWHRGIWYGHGDINGEDFWREKPDKTTARLVVEGEPKISRGTKSVLQATLAMVGAKGNRLGTITQEYEFRREGSEVLIDARIAVAADRGGPLKFGDSDDGGFGFRLGTEFREDHGAELMNSDRLTGTEKIWGKPAKWVKYTASVSGARTGLAVFDHPSNLRHPTGWHARGYSLCSANPFASGSFAKDKSKDGSYTLPTGQTLNLHYLVVIYDGELPPQEADKIFARFARSKS
jgi:hypothetical protein